MADSMEKLEEYLATMPPPEANDSRLLREVAYDRLVDAIRNAGLHPGEPLSENRLSKALGISRTPVREALQQLAQEGIVQIIPGRAITVAAPSMQDVLDALHVRELLEPEVVRLAAEALPSREKETFLQLTITMDQAARARDRPTWSKTDIEWHQILCDYCPNRLLGQMVMQARNRMQNKGSDEHVTDQYLIDGTHEHRTIVDAILAGDGQAAERLMAEHIRQVRANTFSRLARY